MTGRSLPGLEDRLRQALNAPLGEIREGVDMSAAGVTSRLRDACEMSTLALALLEAGAQVPVGRSTTR